MKSPMNGQIFEQIKGWYVIVHPEEREKGGTEGEIWDRITQRGIQHFANVDEFQVDSVISVLWGAEYPEGEVTFEEWREESAESDASVELMELLRKGGWEWRGGVTPDSLIIWKPSVPGSPIDNDYSFNVYVEYRYRPGITDEEEEVASLGY